MAASIAYPVRSPQWILTYNGVNITGDVSQMVLRVEFLDRLEAASSEIEVELEDSTKTWQGPWYPVLGDQLNLMIGYHGEGLLPCGDYQIDDLSLGGPPDVFRLRCLATDITESLRTRNTIGYENQTLIGIAMTIAAKYGLTMVVAPETSDLLFARVTQRRETDLEFLKRIAIEHGYDFSVRAGTLVFYSLAALEGSPPVATVTRSSTLGFEFRNRSREIYRSSQNAYFDPDTKSLISESVTAQSEVAGNDELKISFRCENGQQAQVKAEAALHRSDMRFVEARLRLAGTPSIVAGINATLSGWGALDGVYLVECARHSMSRATGYTTEVEARRVS